MAGKIELLRNNISIEKYTMNFSWHTPIEKLMYWKAGTWSKLENKATNLILRVHYDQLLITADNKVLESHNMKTKIKGIYKEDILIILIWGKDQNFRKIKFQIRADVGQCLQNLGEHFPVVNHNSNQLNTMKPKYRNIEAVIKHALDRNGGVELLEIPSSFNNFVKLCLLDPSFPQMVTETENILKKTIFIENKLKRKL